MTHTELNALPHSTATELDAIPQIKLELIRNPFPGSTTVVYDPLDVADGWDGSARQVRTGAFLPRRLFSKSDYRRAS